MGGDINTDGNFDVADLVLFQKWLLAAPGTELANREAGNFYKDGVLNVLDMCMMKRELLNKSANVDTPDEPIVTNSFESADFRFYGNVYIVGDSTVCNYDETVQQNQNRCGWGMKIAEQYNGVTVTNFARAGISSRSFQNDSEY